MTFFRHTTTALALLLAGCGSRAANDQQPSGPPPVSVVTVKAQPVTLTTELPGRMVPYETSDVRPQVSGIIEARLFTEGDTVHEGQPLYRIDAAPYRAQVANARAALARAKAAIASSEGLVRRYGELVKINAIARQDYENAVTSAAQARADVAAEDAAVRSAEIDLARTVIRAPITGRIGRSIYTTGALVSASQADALATIQRLDPVYVDIQQSSADVLKLRRQILSGEVAHDGNARVKLVLEDGSTYSQEGDLRFADVTVDQSTGSQAIRALFPNPDGLLLPGMFVRARLVEGTREQVMLVPQRAVSRDERGSATVMVVGPGNKLQPRPIRTERTVGDNWVVDGGLRPGDKVVVEGAMILRPGTQVAPQPWNPNARPGPPQGQHGNAPSTQAK